VLRARAPLVRPGQGARLHATPPARWPRTPREIARKLREKTGAACWDARGCSPSWRAATRRRVRCASRSRVLGRDRGSCSRSPGASCPPRARTRSFSLATTTARCAGCSFRAASMPATSAARNGRQYEDGGPAPPPGPHRWTRGRVGAAPAHRGRSRLRGHGRDGLTVSVTAARAGVTVRGNDGVLHTQRLSPSIQPYTFRIAALRPVSRWCCASTAPSGARRRARGSGHPDHRVAVRPAS